VAGKHAPPFAPLPETTLSAVAAELAHRINSPLATLFASLEVVESGRADASDDGALADLRSAAIRIRAVVEHMTHQLVPPGTNHSGLPPGAAPRTSHNPGAAAVRILIVDDDTSVLRSLGRFLRAHDVVTMEDPTAALDRVAHGERFDFILSDLTMPRMNGIQLQKEIARIDPTQAERIVFMTGGATTDEARDFLASTHNTVLAKPFLPEALNALIGRRSG
jgi:CheY-like chemotaxis protein